MTQRLNELGQPIGFALPDLSIVCPAAPYEFGVADFLLRILGELTCGLLSG